MASDDDDDLDAFFDEVDEVEQEAVKNDDETGGGGEGEGGDATSVNVNVNVNAVLKMIQHIFEEEWSRQEKTVAGPLAGVEIVMQAI
mmetsp:Transcript_2184/g.2928  ORF Transcript_2184/g.2928 Transcript_2184/m.2928 type:complete len:87 (-) Transcript_2184:122-382(-)